MIIRKTFKRYISVILALLVAAAVFPLSAGAFTGYAGNARWEIKDGVLTVSGGSIPSYTASSAPPWKKFSDKVTSVVIGEGVKTIGNRAFEDMSSVTKADLGSVKFISAMAFSGCSSLTSVVLPDTVQTVSTAAFAECKRLYTVTLSENLTSMGTGVFEACPSLRSFSGGSTRYAVHNGAIYDTVNQSVFRSPPASTYEFNLPRGITRIESGAFRDCVHLEAIDLTGVTSVGNGAFYGCTSLKDVNMPSIITVGSSAFYGCAMDDIAFGSKLSQIGDSAFAFCTALTRADFSGDAPKASESIFYGTATGFTVVISEESEGFSDVWLGYPVLRHGIYSGNLGDITWTLDSHTGIMSVTGNGAIPDFESADGAPWYPYRNLMRSLELNGITEIGKNSFRYSGLCRLTIPETVKKIGEWAFSGCDSLTRVTAPYTAEIDSCAFFGCISLTMAELDSAVQIGSKAFSGCTELKYIFTGKSAPAIGEYAFDLSDPAILYPAGGTGYGGENLSGIYTEQYYPGDANADGKCNVTDALMLLRYIAKWNVSIQKISSDVNYDGHHTVGDVTAILKYIAKWDIQIGLR